MGFSIAQAQNTSTILAEIALADPESEEIVESQEISEETVDGQMKSGILRGESKEYVLIKQLASDIPHKFSDSLLEMGRPEQKKLADPKSGLHQLVSKKEDIKEKVFKTIASHKPIFEKRSFQEQKLKPNSLPQKTHQSAQQTLTTAKLPPSAARMRENILKQQQHTSRSAELRIQKELSRKEQTKDPQKRSAERQSPSQNNERFDKNFDKHEERERKKQDDQEGFAGKNQDSSQDDTFEEEKCSEGISPIDHFSKGLSSYAAQESILSQLFNMRVSQFDVLILFLEIMKLDIKNSELQELSRREERELQIMHMEKVVQNYKDQGNWQLFASLGSGILSIVSGALPIVGYMKGDWVIEKLKSFSMFSGLEGQNKDKVFKNFAKIVQGMSEMQRSTGQIQETFYEGHRTFDQHMSDLYKSDWEESTRNLDDIKQNWKSIENFLYQSLQMYHDSVRSLYN
jgi:hypothetical protein